MTLSTAKALIPNAIALGNFDGIHRGHQQVVQPILEYTKSCDGAIVFPNAKPCQEITQATVVTFNPHPREFFTGESQQLLTPYGEKVELLAQLGVDQLILLPFDRELANLSPQDFVAKILVEQLQTSVISVGQDFRFGHQREGTSEDLRAIASQFGIDVHITPLQICQGDRISSSLIREALAVGDITRANHLLGRTYTLTGKVVIGQQLGRTLGFPTANLQVPEEKLLPRSGVYAVQVYLDNGVKLSGEHSFTPRREDAKENAANYPLIGQYLDNDALWGVMNIGCRPTVDGTKTTIEVHLLDWCGDLYGQQLTVSLVQFLRPEQKFASLDALKARIAEDCQRVRMLNDKCNYID